MTCEAVALVSVIIIVLIYLVHWYLTKDFNYWKDKHVPFLKPVFLFGSVKNVILTKTSYKSFVNKCYTHFKTHGFGGVFFVRVPSLWVSDPNIIEKILVEDFAYFHDRWFKRFDGIPEGRTLLFSKGEQWRRLRLKLAPAFASGKVKGMFQQILTSTDNLLVSVSKSLDLVDEVEFQSLTSDFATEVLVSCLCGVQMSNSKEAEDFKKALNIIFKPSLHQNILRLLSMILPRKLVEFIGFGGAHHEAVKTLSNVVKSILIHRKVNGAKRNDVLQTMFDINEEEINEFIRKEDECKKIPCLKNYIMGSKIRSNIFFTEETIAAQILTFLSGGIKPIAGTITYALFEISKNTKIQNNLHQEIDSSVLKHKGWSLETLKNMSYLDQVIQEVLRMYSINPVLIRAVNKNYTIPGTDVTLDKVMQVFIPSDGIHKDPDLYPNPSEFRPERWEGNNYRSSATFLPFGHGPRICISIRLAVLTIKLCLARVLSRYQVSISPRMRLPLQFDDEFDFKAKGGVWVKCYKRNNLL